MSDEKPTAKKRGRPLGYKLSDESKEAISNSKKGQQHSQETKDKISKSLMLYFRRLHPLSDEITNTYCRIDDDELCSWVNTVREEIDELGIIGDIFTDRVMANTRKIEIAYGQNIEYFSHSLTPEEILELKELCKEKGIDIKDYISY